MSYWAAIIGAASMKVTTVGVALALTASGAICRGEPAQATVTCPWTYAHRGYTTGARHDPNTLPAIGAAYRIGVTGAEIDLQPDADHALVLIHAPTLDVATDGTGFVYQRNSSYISGLQTHHGERVAFWSGYLQQLKAHPHTRGLVEIKASPAWSKRVIRHRLLDPAHTRHLLGRLVFYSRDLSLLAVIDQLRPQVETGVKGHWWRWPAAEVTKYADSAVLTPKYPRSEIRAIHTAGGRVYLRGTKPAIWTADIRKAADGIMTGRPRRLAHWCGS